MLPCENPLSPLRDALEAAAAITPRSNHYTESHSAPLRGALSEKLAVPEEMIHINFRSEFILRQFAVPLVNWEHPT